MKNSIELLLSKVRIFRPEKTEVVIPEFEGRISEEWMLYLIESIIKGDAVYLPGSRKDNSLDAIFATHNFFDIYSPEKYPPSTFFCGRTFSVDETGTATFSWLAFLQVCHCV